jgi:hypothetical protein
VTVGLEERGTAELERVRGEFLQLRQRLFRLVAPPCRRNAVASKEVPYYIGIMSIEDIEKAVASLPPDQYAQFRTWFEAFEADRFDRKIERDAQAGKLDRLADQAIDYLRKSRAKPPDPFALFSEWSSEADEKAFRDL